MFHVKQNGNVSRETIERRMFLKKIIAILLLILTVVLAVGCENVEYLESSAPEEESKNIYEQLENQLPSIETDENGEVIKQKFTIATDEKSVFYNEETASGSVSKAVAKRNDFLFDKYGAEITVYEASANEITQNLKTALESGVEYCDMICLSAKNTVKLATAGFLYDMNTLPNFNIENAYFDPNNAKVLATNSTLYLLPDPTAQIYDELYVTFFNRNLVNETAGKDPESLVMQGKWTWDAFHETAKASAPDVYNKSSSDIVTDTFGFGAYYGEGVYPYVVWASTGEKLVNNTYKNPVSLSLTAEYITDVCKNLVKAYNTRGRFPLDANDAMSAFESGRLAFFNNKLSYFYALRDGSGKGSEYGILPMPKHSEEQGAYYSLASTDARVFSAPRTLQNADEKRRAFVSAVIQATCAAGRVTVHDAYIAHFIGQYLNNNAETVMLQTIIDSATFDFAHVYGSVISEIRRPTTDAISDYIDFGSAVGSSISRTIAGFNKYCEENFK